MDDITYSALLANLAGSMDRVCDSREPLLITHDGERSVVMVSLEDYRAMEETAYLLDNPVTAKRLLSAVVQLGASKSIEGRSAKQS